MKEGGELFEVLGRHLSGQFLREGEKRRKTNDQKKERGWRPAREEGNQPGLYQKGGHKRVRRVRMKSGPNLTKSGKKNLWLQKKSKGEGIGSGKNLNMAFGG